MSYPQVYPQEIENFEVTVYAADAEDFDNEGICGPLEAISCEHTEEAIEAGGKNEITLICNKDAEGKWTYLTGGNIIRCYVQMRTPPEITDAGRIVTSVERWRVNGSASKANRYVYNKQSGGKKLKLLAGNTEVVVTSAPASGRYKIVSKQANGWIAPAALTYEVSETIPESPTGIEAVLPGAQIRPQLFEIQTVEPGEHDITVWATHLSYQLNFNDTAYSNDGAVTAQQAARGLLANAEDPTDFKAYSDLNDTRTGVRWTATNPIKAFFDPESGIVSKWPCEALRDNFDIYFLSAVGLDRGVRVEPGKNLSGVKVSEDISGLYTHIKPIGRNKNGTELLLPERLIASPYAAAFGYKRIFRLDCSGCTVGKNGNQTQVYAEMRRQAQALLDSGIDLPNVSLQADIAQIDGIEGMEIIAQLEPMLIYDYIRILTPQYQTLVYNRVMRRKWDCLHGRLLAVETGMVEDLSKAKFSTWQIPAVSGDKIIAGTLGSGALGDDIIAARHMQADSVNTDALAAGSVTANKIDAAELTASQASIDRLKSAWATITGAYIEGLTAGSVETDRLGAALAQFTQVIAGTAEFDEATIRHLVSSVFNLDGSGSAEDLYIYNLLVTYAQMAAAIVQDLALKGDDGHYYRISVSNGQLSPVLIPDDEIDEDTGMTADGKRSLIDSALSRLDMTSGPTVKGLVGVINRIYASVIDTDVLLARQGFIADLYTNRLFGGKSIQDMQTDFAELTIGSRNYIRGSRSLSGARQLIETAGRYDTAVYDSAIYG